MKESISYSFLLNIVILFIFVCFAIIMGTMSYYKAFRANSIISETIEKYEGYNCASKEEIAKKLNTISYKAPFNVSCNANDGKCQADNENGYKVISYNLDFDDLRTNSRLLYNDIMDSSYICDGNNGCATNKHYQYGIYTYMYIEFPVISQLMKLSFFSKTSVMYEFRNFYSADFEKRTPSGKEIGTRIVEVESTFDGLFSKEEYQGTNEELKGKEFVIDKIQKYGGVGSGADYKESSMTYLTDALVNNSMDYTMDASTGTIRNIETIFQFITGTGMPDYRQRAMMDLMVKGTGEGKINYLPTTFDSYGKDGWQRNKDCSREQYKLDFGAINY